MLSKYFKIAWRNLRNHRATGTINILGLAIGIFACMAIWLLTHFELSYDKFHPDKERIFRLVSEFHGRSGEVNHWGEVPEPVADQARLELSGIETIADFHNYNACVSITDGNVVLKKFPKISGGQNNDDLVFAEPQYFELFKYQWVAGNPRTALNEPFRVVLSTSEAQKYFGQTDWGAILGRQIIYDDSLRVTVSGIVKDWSRNTDFTFKDFISYSTIRASFLKNDFAVDQWGQFNSSSQVFVKLAKRTTPFRVETELQAFASRHIKSFEKEQQYRMLLQPLSDLHFSTTYDKDYGRQAHLTTLYGLMGIAIFILIIASINFINLSTAQSLQRAKEIGIRKVLGSSRVRLITQFLIETFMLTILALVICIVLLKPVLSSIPSFVPKEFSVNILDPQTVGFMGLIIAVTTILAGFYPGWLLSSFLPAQALRNQVSLGKNPRKLLRKGLVVFQFTVSLVFIIAAIVIGNQMHFMLNKEMGFSKNAIVNLSTNGKEPPNKRQLLAERIRALPGVEKVSMNWFTPAFNGEAGTTIDYSGPPLIKTDVNFRIADEHYIPLYELKLLAGRNFFHSDTLHELVINETYVKLLGFHKPLDAIGKTLKMWNKQCPIVGVVSDFNIKPLRAAIEPVVIGSDEKNENGYSVKLQTQGNGVVDFKNTMSLIEKCWKDIFPNEQFQYQFFDETINKFYSKEQKTAQVISASMFIAIFVSCMGLFGLAALTAEKRRKEIGIRKVLGASVSGIISLLSKDFLQLVFISILIASPVAWYFMHRWLQDFAYKVPIRWWMFVLAGSGAITIALVTVSFQAIKAAIANPVKSLRTE